MKAYLFDTFNRFKRLSDKLDATTILSNKSWWVFNDEGVKETYIFHDDGSMIISVNGQVTDAKWEYETVNNSIVIRSVSQKVMVHPAFMDGVIMALQLDGTQKYAFLLDENNKANFAPQTYSAVIEYFEEKERRFIEKENKTQEIILEKKANDTFFNWDYCMISILLGVAIGFIPVFYTTTITNANNERTIIFLCFSSMFLVPVCFYLIYRYFIHPKFIKKKYNEFINKNPGDPIIPYLTKLCSKYL